ncbi:MAG: protease SohB [Arsenophonus sp.]|nr:MAG: protease SohB [Arsenophonus sp.]
MDFIFSYILFFVKLITIVALFCFLISLLFSINIRKSKNSYLKVVNLNKIYSEYQRKIYSIKMNYTEYKKWFKKYKQNLKKRVGKNRLFCKSKISKKNSLFVINFKGSINAQEVHALREEITAILSVANKKDEVLLRLESPGGVVHGYGLAAAQLSRLKEKNIRLTISIDKIAASGGYMMACVADYIIAAPFAIIGSIGVVAQIPNIHNLLKKNNIDIEQHTTGEYKRTLTVLGENTEEGRKKFIEELYETHNLFKDFVHKNRKSLDIQSVSNGKHWYGIESKKNGLVDELKLSDDFILEKINTHDIIEIIFSPSKCFIENFINIIFDKIKNSFLHQ